MDFHADASYSPDQPLGSWRDHIGLILTLFPIMAAVVRIFVVSYGDSATLAVLVRTLNVTSVVVGTFAQLVPYVSAIAAYACWVRVINISESPDRRMIGLARVYAVIATIAAMIIAGFASLSISISVAIGVLISAITIRRAARSSGFVLVGAALALALTALLTPTMWLPAESIILKDGAQVAGYVLEVSDQYVTVLIRGAPDVRIIQQELVETRAICKSDDQLPSVAALITGTAEKRPGACP